MHSLDLISTKPKYTNKMLKNLEFNIWHMSNQHRHLDCPALADSETKCIVMSFMKVLNYLTYWKAVKTQKPVMEYTALLLTQRYRAMPDSQVILTASTDDFTPELLQEMLDGKFLGDAVVMGELTVHEDDFTTEWHNQGNFTHLGVQWVIMARLVVA